MSVFKKYNLVPSTTTTTTNGATTHLPSFSTNPPSYRIQDKLHSLNENQTLKDDERWRQFTEIFHDYFKHHKPPLLPTAASTPSSPSSNILEDSIKQSLPKNVLKKGELLLNFIKTKNNTSSSLTWNDQGELIHLGQPIPGANLVDIVHFAVRKPRKNIPEPIGWKQFYALLNIPREFLHPELSRKLHHLQSSSDSLEEENVFWETVSQQDE